MENKVNLPLIAALIVILMLSLYAFKLNSAIKKMKVQPQNSSASQAEPVKQATYIKFHEAEDQIIAKIKETEKYKEEAKNVEPYAYLKFDNSGFFIDDSWAFGLMNYYNVYKETDNSIYIKDKPLAAITSGMHYIIKFKQNGDVEKLLVTDHTHPKEWNNELNNLPKSIMKESDKQFYILPTGE